MGGHDRDRIFVCAHVIEYDDGTILNRAIHRGPRAECEEIDNIIPVVRRPVVNREDKIIGYEELTLAPRQEGKLVLRSVVAVLTDEQFRELEDARLASAFLREFAAGT